jgi:hypothetical protein
VSVSNSNFIFLWDAIAAKLVAELPPGGKLAGVKRVGKDWLDQAKVYPYVYVGHQGFHQTPYSSHKHKRVDDFVIGVACRSTVSLEDAMRQIYTYMDDGSGKGVLAVLNDPANYTWGGLAQHSFVTEQRYYDSLAASKTAATNEFVAYAVIRYAVTQFLTWQGPVG